MVGLRQRALVPGLILIGLIVSIVSSLGAPLIPTIADDLHSSLSSTQWSLTVTVLVGAVASPVVGRLGDGPRRREVLLVLLGLVTLGGVLAAIAPTLVVLIAGRALQGFGLALMPLTMAAARDELPADKAGPAIATLSVVAAVGVGLGYPITGLLAETFGTSAAFWFGASTSLLALVVAALVVPPSRPENAHQSLDPLGALLVGGGLVALLVALEKGASWGWGSTTTLGLLVLAVVLLGLFTRHALRIDEPLVDLRLFRHRAVLTANATGLVLGVAMYLSISLMTQFVQLDLGFGETVFVAGLTLVPLSALSSFASRLLPGFRERFGQRAAIPVGSLAVGAGILFFGLTGNALWQAFVAMGLVGLGLGFTFAAMPSLIVGAVPAEETSSAMSLYQVSRYIGFSVGSGLAVTLLQAFGPAAGADATAYREVFLVGTLLAVGAALVAWFVPGHALDRGTRVPRDTEDEEGELASAGLGTAVGD